ncbi:Macro domain-containing protein [Sulfidibacter corallicola]|uniref:Macro domain-containing protein n=1 Tax=Sulfidibacter corallicola TaxID=2818388 RepID=A0A8A4TVL9_SULCO|nr:macro domain-containing protein [Sulfidibacter corallicola]QTD53174.1 macro domain-containing protein [Sulfidibacter corallicola]
MITYIEGDLFQSPAKVLVNAVNTVGVMGKGIALQFKKRYPDMFRDYRELCERKDFTIGKLHLHTLAEKWILNFPTKTHWRRPSKLEYIEEGLKCFEKKYAEAGIESIAFPLLGCGNGELPWHDVKPMMEKHLKRLPIQVFIYLYKNETLRPEHRCPHETNHWIHADPKAIPFQTVLEDIKSSLEANPNLKTLETGTNLKARITVNQQREKLQLEAKERTLEIDREDLLDLWHLLRDNDYLYANLVSQRLPFEYLMPIFLRLPYVTFTEVKDSGRAGKNRALCLVPGESQPLLRENELPLIKAK